MKFEIWFKTLKFLSDWFADKINLYTSKLYFIVSNDIDMDIVTELIHKKSAHLYIIKA